MLQNLHISLQVALYLYYVQILVDGSSKYAICKEGYFQNGSFSIIRVGPYIRPYNRPSGTDSFFFNLGFLELSYRFQTLHDDSCSTQIFKIEK